MVKYWANSDTGRSVYLWDPTTPVHKITMYHAWLINGIVTNASVTSRGEIAGHFQFPSMDRISHKTANYTLAIAMYSNRIKNFEVINGENKHGWYTGAGMTYLYNNDIDHYQDDFWPTVDPYRLPGTTIDKRVRADSATAGRFGTSIVGGAAVGASGVVCMKVSLDSGQLVALKSWFCLGDRVVMVGSGITGTTANLVETIIENRNIGVAGSNLVKMNSTATNVLTNVGTQETLPAAWLHVEGVGGIVPIGTNSPIRGVRNDSSGKWSDICGTAGTPTDTRTRRYITLWFDHGATPVNAGYAYALFPTYSASTTASYAAAPTITVPIRNTSVHYLAAQISTTQIYSAVFWTDTPNIAGVFTCDAIAAVMLRIPATGEIEIALSDPTQMRTSSITITVQVANGSIVSSDPATTVTRTGSSVTIVYNPTGARGRTAKVVLNP
jgi:hyaluronate lyase